MSVTLDTQLSEAYGASDLARPTRVDLSPACVLSPVLSWLLSPEGIIHDGLWDVYNDHHMGICAEKCSQSYGIGREAQDAHARESYERAALAWDKVRDLTAGAELLLVLPLLVVVAVVLMLMVS